MEQAGWNAEKFRRSLKGITNHTVEEDKSLPGMQHVITEALDSLFGDYVDLKKNAPGDLDWLGTHVWNDVERLQGPAITSPASVPQQPRPQPDQVRSLPHIGLRIRDDWHLTEAEPIFGEGRATWGQLIDHFIDGSWHPHDNPDSKFQQVFRATAAPGYTPQLPPPNVTPYADVPRMQSESNTAARPSPQSIAESAVPGRSRTRSRPSTAQSRASSTSGDSIDEDRTRKRKLSEACQDSKALSRAAERRSRLKLNNSMQELVLAVPGLAESNRSRAEVIHEAAKYLQALQRETEDLQAMVAELSKARELETAHKTDADLSGVVTLEIVSSTFKFLYVDAAWEDVMGYPARDVMGKATHDFFNCTRCALIISISLNIKERLEAGLDWKGVMICRRANGDYLACWGHMYGCKDDQGKFVNYICTRKNFVVLDVERTQALCEMQDPKEMQLLLDNELLAQQLAR